jgi:hypothetical protein
MRSRILVLVVLISCFTSAAAYSQCHAITSLPVTITQPGTWCLTGDLSYNSTNAAINVSASGVTVDLNGFHLSSQGYGVYSWGGYSDLVIRNGEITASYRGIYIETGGAVAANVVISNLVIDAFNTGGIYLNGQFSSIHDVYVHAPNGASATAIYATSVDVDHVRVDGSYAYGIYSTSNGNRSIRNSSTAGNNAGIYTAGLGTANIVNCEISGGLNYGVYVSNGYAAIIGNRINAAAYPIVFIGSGTGKYRDNVFTGATFIYGTGTDAGNNT